MGNTFLSAFGRYVQRYWWSVVGPVIVWKLLEHWALTKADEYIGSHIGVTVQRVSTFLHVDMGTVVLVLVFVGIGAHAAFNARQQIKTYEICFDYLPGNLLDNGWVRAYPKDTQVRPKATLASKAPLAGSITIDAPDGHAYDYQLPRNVILSDRLVFAAKYSPTTMIFTQAMLSSKDRTRTVYKWIKYEPGVGPAYPTKGYEDYEWTFPITGEPLQNQWRKFDISLPEVVARTWAKQGLVFKGITMFRVRGSLDISPIEFFESRTHHDSV